ncbi:hypothetical protein [Pseudomonas sp.]|uniref:hypothetical protein n=1 Tax=Pseudomonas sp. TaxID=306 RepID=UPI0031DC2C69
MSDLKRFFEALNNEEKKIIPALASDRLGLLLRCAINELDWYGYNFSRADNPTTSMEEQFYILRLGVVRLIKLSLDSNASFDFPVVTTVRRRELTIPVLEIASALGMIQHGRRVAQTVMQGIGSIKEVSSNVFEIVLPEDVVDESYHEREVFHHFQAESRRLFSEIKETAAWQNVEAEVDALLFELVYVFEKHYIGYGGDPLLDQYFYSLAYHEMMLCEGFDTFNYKVTFGGVRFQSYILALVYISSIFRRHERFCEALVEKDSSVRLENILTISSDRDGFVESIRDAVNHFGRVFEDFEEISISQADTIFNVLSCGRSNTSLIDAPGAPVPFMIRCSEEGFIRCLTGGKTEPVRYLLDSLRFHYPKDYDRHQQGRELSMQRAARRVLDDAISGLDYRDNIVLRLGGRTLTDVDFVVLEKDSGIVILCQLKYQELYGADLHAKRVRSDRLRQQVAGWIEAVDEWLETIESHKLRETLQLVKDFPEPRICRLVISKHFSHPLRGLLSGGQDFHCNWPLFVNAALLAKRDSSNPGLDEMLQIIKRVQENLKIPTHFPEPSTRWKIDELVFLTTQQKSSESFD